MLPVSPPGAARRGGGGRCGEAEVDVVVVCCLDGGLASCGSCILCLQPVFLPVSPTDFRTPILCPCAPSLGDTSVSRGAERDSSQVGSTFFVASMVVVLALGLFLGRIFCEPLVPVEKVGILGLLASVLSAPSGCPSPHLLSLLVRVSLSSFWALRGKLGVVFLSRTCLFRSGRASLAFSGLGGVGLWAAASWVSNLWGQFLPKTRASKTLKVFFQSSLSWASSFQSACLGW